MTSALVDDNPQEIPTGAPTDAVADPGPGDRGLRRFVIAAVVGFGAVTIPYVLVLWDLWTGRFDLFRQLNPDNFYDLQGHAMLAGHLWVPKGSLGIEAFVHGGRDYTYFGLFPSLIRLPVLALTHAYDGRLTAPSMLIAWCVTGLFASLLLWRVRVLIRGDAAIGVAEAVASGITLAALTGGSVLVYLASSPKVSHEDLAWSVALTVGAVFALLGVLERPSWRRVGASGVLVLAASLDRAPTGYACCLAAALIAGWFALPRNRSASRQWIVPMALVAVVPLALVGLVNWLKLGTPFGLSEADQVWTQVNPHRRRVSGRQWRQRLQPPIPPVHTDRVPAAGRHSPPVRVPVDHPSHVARPHCWQCHPRRNPPDRQLHCIDAPDHPSGGLGHRLGLPAASDRPGGPHQGAAGRHGGGYVRGHVVRLRGRPVPGRLPALPDARRLRRTRRRLATSGGQGACRRERGTGGDPGTRRVRRLGQRGRRPHPFFHLDERPGQGVPQHATRHQPRGHDVDGPNGGPAPVLRPGRDGIRHVRLLGSLRLDRLRLRHRAASTADA